MSSALGLTAPVALTAMAASSSLPLIMNKPSLTGFDVGAPGLAGKLIQSAQEITIVAGGEDIWGPRDEFHFAYLPVT